MPRDLLPQFGANARQLILLRHIKVVLETKRSGTSHQEIVQGSGSVIIRCGTVGPLERITANDRQTTVQRSSGVFTLVLDGRA
ncbi:MAG TPA: hypothetical protein VH985_10970 [Candidatus Binatia bacterium]